MNYEIEKDNKVYYYHVIYDENKLREILEELKNYNYTCIGHGKYCGKLTTKWPNTNSAIKKRMISFYNKTRCQINGEICPETIVHHTENDSDYVTYDYSFNKFPDLYDYIDFLINSGDPHKYFHLFGTNKFDYLWHHNQMLIDGLLNYYNSPELKMDNSNTENNMNYKNYDYKGLNELYKKTLKCFKFNLVAIKEKIDTQEEIDGLSMQKKKVKTI